MSDWLADKITGTPWVLAAIYRPLSHISLERWTAGHYTTNISESKHKQLNLDGTSLSLVGGIMAGYDFDKRAAALYDQSSKYLMQRKYKGTTPHFQQVVSHRRRCR